MDLGWLLYDVKLAHLTTVSIPSPVLPNKRVVRWRFGAFCFYRATGGPRSLLRTQSALSLALPFLS